MSEDKVQDLVIIGGGSGAFAAAIRAAELDARVTVIERETIGGTCVNRGCVPSKNLLHAAELAHAGRGGLFPGIAGSPNRLDISTVIGQKDELVRDLRKMKYEDLLGAYPNIEFLQGDATFGAPNAVSVGNQTVRGRYFIIATGASPAVPPIPGLTDVPYMTYRDAISITEVPKSTIVIGGGAIGLELGQMLARFGSKVTVIEAMDHIAPNEEPEISDELKAALSAEMEIHTATKVTHIQKTAGCYCLEVKSDEKPWEIRAEALLVATGVSPNTRSLNLDAAGVQTDRRGAVIVDQTMRTAAEHIYAVGDCIGRTMLVTTAAAQGGMAAENALRRKNSKIDEAGLPHAIFTSPEAASCGLKESEAKDKGIPIEIGLLPFKHVPKAAAIRDTHGILKLVAHAETFKILGAHITGDRAADLIHIGVLAVRHGLTAGDFMRATFVYPTMAEAYKLAALAFKKDISKLSCCAA